MGTKNYNNYSDLITFSRASSGTALAKISYGPELVTNGTFDTDFSGWTVIGQQPSVVNSQLRLTTSSVNVGVSQNVGLQAGKMYLASYDIISITGGSMRLALGSAANGTNRTAPGSYSEFLYVSGDAVARLYQVTSFSAEVIVVDNISIKEVLYDQPDGTLQLFNHPTNQPRVEYDYQGNRLGLLVEEARTNLLTYSEDFTQWTQSQVTISSNAIEAPDGTLTATKTIEDQTSNFHYVQKSSFGVGNYTYSIFLKAAERKYAGIHIHDGSAARGCSIDLETGTLGTPYGGATASVTSFPSGWWRLSVAVTTTGSGVAVVYSSTSNALASYLGDGASGVYIWGAQVETGSFPTSYIPTAGSTVTRAADVASIGVGAFGYNKTAGSLVVQTRTETVDQWIVGIAYFNTASFLNSRGFVKSNAGNTSGGNRYLFTSYDGASTLVNLADANTGQSVKLGSAWKDSENAVVDGGTVQTGTIRNPAPTDLRIGGRDNGFQSRCHISSIAYYPRRLTDAQIKALTSPPETPTLSLTFDDSSTSYLETSIHG